jgi:glycosyltransferase involved in cell wall biosynthesis
MNLTAIIPTLGRIPDVIKLVCNLEGQKISSVVVFDGEPYPSKAQLKQFPESVTLHYLENNVGQAEATDAALEFVKTSNILLMDSDDVINIEDISHLEHTLNEELKGCVLFPETLMIKRNRIKNRDFINEKVNLRVNSIGAQSGVVFSKADYVLIGGQSKVLRSCKDWDMWISCVSHNFNFETYNATISYNLTLDGISRDLKKVVKGRLLLWDKHPSIFKAQTRIYDWYYLIRYLSFNCCPNRSAIVGKWYLFYYPIHTLVYYLYSKVK